ncbi:hypothetical protein QJQ45_013120 [Haematococcus lacustris]|nr:hypothetical protein QJQ45_013120 [Haematococcus lacustris]
MAADVVLRKALASKFANDWLFRYNSDGIVVCQCKRCPPNNRAELGVASQLAARHKCKLEGVDVYKEKHYRTQLLDELYSEVKQATFKELRKLAKDGFVLVSDGWKNKFAGRGSPLINFLVLKPYGGMLFLRVVDVSGTRKDAGAIKELHMEVLQDLCKDMGLASVECHGVIMDNTAANHSAMRMMQREMPTISVALAISDSEAIRSELKAQQANHSAYSVRPNNPTRFAGLLLMAEDVEKLMPAIHGMVHGDNWPQLRLSSANAAVFEKCVTTPWYKSLKLVIKLMKPISNAIHRLEADAPYLSQVLMVWNALVDHAKEWVEHAVIVSPRLALGVVAAFQRRAQTHYSPAYAAAYALDPANYKYLAPGTHPRPTMHRLQPTQQEDVVTVVARLAECSLGAARRELTLLTLGDWPTDMKSSVEANVAETRTDEDGKTTTACISVRSGFWTFLGARCFPNLRLAAVRLLAMHVTTAAAERNWSSWGNTYNAGRSQLNVPTAENMVFIKANIPSSEPSEPSQLLAEGITT